MRSEIAAISLTAASNYGLVGFRRFAITAHFADELQGSGLDVLGGGGRFHGAQCFDGSAHEEKPIGLRHPILRSGDVVPVPGSLRGRDDGTVTLPAWTSLTFPIVFRL